MFARCLVLRLKINAAPTQTAIIVTDSPTPIPTDECPPPLSLSISGDKPGVGEVVAVVPLVNVGVKVEVGGALGRSVGVAVGGRTVAGASVVGVAKALGAEGACVSGKLLGLVEDPVGAFEGADVD